ncbi:unnamed protein product [Prunus armeniaca]
MPCNMRALCCLRHHRARAHCLATCKLCVAFGTFMFSHIALRHASFVLPSAPRCLATMPCNMRALCCLRHHHARPHCLATCKLCVAFGTFMFSHIALRHASFVSPLAPSCLATSLCDMQVWCCLWHPCA